MSYGKITITVEASVDLEQWKAFTGAVSDEEALAQAERHLPSTAVRQVVRTAGGCRRRQGHDDCCPGVNCLALRCLAQPWSLPATRRGTVQLSAS